MASQQRPLFLGGQINDNQYIGNFCVLDREHPNPRIATLVNRVLVEIGGYAPGRGGPGAAADKTAPMDKYQESMEVFLRQALTSVAKLKGSALKRARAAVVDHVAAHAPAPPRGPANSPAPCVDDLPRFVPLMVEMQGDDVRREVYRALYEGVAIHLARDCPELATAALIRAHLTALGASGGYARPAPYIPPEGAPAEQPQTAPPAPAPPAAAEAPADQPPAGRRRGRLHVTAPLKTGATAPAAAAVAEQPPAARAESPPAAEGATAGGDVSLGYWEAGPPEIAHLPPGATDAPDLADQGREVDRGSRADPTPINVRR